MTNQTRRKIKRRRAKFIRSMLFWVIVILLVVGVFWQLDTIKIMQTDTLDKLNDVDVAVTYAAELPDSHDVALVFGRQNGLVRVANN